MSPTTIMVYCAIAVALTLLAAWVFAPRPKKSGEDIEALAARLRGNRDRIIAGGQPRTRSAHGGFDSRPRDFGKRAVPPRLKTFTLTPRQLEHVNIQRKLRGSPPLNRAGFKAAASLAATQASQPNTTTDWLTYLIIYECLFADHQSHTVSTSSGMTIDPNQPDNGCGGTFGGAGASGTWTPDVQTSAEHIAAGRMDSVAGAAAGLATGAYILGADPAKADDAPQSAPYVAPDPAPSYSAPDPTPSPSPAPSFDSSPSPSFDSSPSVSIDTSPM